MDALTRDIKHALRLLSGNRGFATATLLTIALGVGGTSAVSSVFYGILLRPLPFPEPERLVRMWEVHPGARAPIPGPLLSLPTYLAWSRSSKSLEDIAAFRGTDYTVTRIGATERLRGTRVTPSLFRLLRVSPAAGRFFADADAEKGAPPVVVLGHALWRDRFGADPAAVGSAITIDRVDHRIIGIAPPGFAFPEKQVGLRDDRREVTLYTIFPVAMDPNAKVIDIANAVARLKPAATIAQAEAEGTSYARSVDRPLSDLVFGKGQAVEVRVRSLVDQMTMRVRPALLVLASGVALVLLVACANVANLFLSHGYDRARELAVRSAIGASRWRLVRQLLTESLVIALIGGILGACVGWAITTAVPFLAPTDFPRLDAIHVDTGLLAAAAVAAVFVGVVSGATPALRGSRVDLGSMLQAFATRGAGRSGTRVRRGLLVLEAALAIVLLVGAALLARSLIELVRVDAGYEPVNVLTADLRMPAGADTPERTWQLTASTLERLRTIAGVRAAGAGDMAPFGRVLSGFAFTLPGMTTADGRPLVATAHRAVSPGYAEALGMQLEEGRFFRADDTTSAIRSMLVNETFAKTYFADGRPATGRRFAGIFPRWLGKEGVVEVVGVVHDMLPDALDGKPQPQIFVAQGAGVAVGNATFVVKTADAPAAVAPLLKDIVQQVEPGATLERVGPLSAKISASVGDQRFAASVLGVFAALALALATTGLYGVLSYHVAQRRREIGVRAALGASRGTLVWLVLQEGLVVTVCGLAIGTTGAVLAARAMSTVLFGIGPLDRFSFAFSAFLLLAVASAACLIPAWRAAAVDPAQALRAE